MSEVTSQLIFGLISLGGLFACLSFWRRSKVTSSSLGRGVSLTVCLMFVFLGWKSLQKSAVDADAVVILTQGSESKDVARLLRKLPEGTPLYALPGAPQLAGVSQMLIPVPDAGWLHRNLDLQSVWHVTGWGLPSEILPNLSSRRLRFHASKAPMGMSHSFWPSTLELGKAFTFSGRMDQPNSKGWRASLWAPSGEMVAEKALEAEETEILLQDRPATSGLLTYRLRLQDANGEIQLEEELPVQVNKPKSLHVWCLLGSPRFDLKFLKRYLGETGASMLIRTRLTDEDWRDEVVNRDPISKPTHALPWEEADILLIDGAALLALDNRARNAIRQAVAQGLGVFLYPDQLETYRKDLPTSSWDFFCDWSIQWEEEGIEQLQAGLQWRGDFPNPTTKVEILPAAIQLKSGQQVLADDGFGGVLAASIPRGKGMVATSLVRQSQSWVLRGASSDFRSYWSHMLSQISRPVTAPPGLNSPSPSWVNQPMSLTIWADKSAILRVEESGSQIPLAWRTDPLAFGRRAADFIPKHPGWHLATWGNQALPAFYVFPENAWQTIRAEEKVKAMNAHVNGLNGSLNQGKSKRFPWEVLTICLALIGLTTLWLGEKLQRL